MGTLTSRAQIYKAARSEVMDPETALWPAIDRIDSLLGAQTVTSSTRPATPYVGQIIRETDTNRVLVRTDEGTWDTIPTEATPLAASRWLDSNTSSYAAGAWHVPPLPLSYGSSEILAASAPYLRLSPGWWHLDASLTMGVAQRTFLRIKTFPGAVLSTSMMLEPSATVSTSALVYIASEVDVTLEVWFNQAASIVIAHSNSPTIFTAKKSRG